MNNRKTKNNSPADIILSISALTYNQPEELRRLMLSVLPQMQPGAEIVINDNSDNLETESMIKNEFNSPYVRYFKNENNVGAERNIILATERSLGKYVWWFGDDEMEPGAINHVLKIIKDHPEISLILVNHREFGYKPALDLREDKFLLDSNQVIDEVTNLLGFMSSIIFKKEALLDVDREAMESFIGSDFMGLFLVMHILSGKGKFFYVNQPYVCMYHGPPDKFDKSETLIGFRVFAVSFYKVVMNFKDKFDRKSIKKMLAKNFGHVWRGILVGWLNGYNTPKGKLWPMFKLYWNFPEFWLAAPFFIMPKFVTRFVYFIYKKILKLSYSTVKSDKRKIF